MPARIMDNLEAPYKVRRARIDITTKVYNNNTLNKGQIICLKKKLMNLIWIFRMRWTTPRQALLMLKIVLEDITIMNEKRLNLKRAHQMITMGDKLMIKVIRHHPVMSIVAQEN